MSLDSPQFKYTKPSMGDSQHRLSAQVPTPQGPRFAMMHWTPKEVTHLSVPEGAQRQGVATAMWHEGHRLASENARIPAPKHSADRTNAGDAWAKSVGGKLPRRKRD
jgi:hypothetical protein